MIRSTRWFHVATSLLALFCFSLLSIPGAYAHAGAQAHTTSTKQASCPQLPAHFDPLKASPTQLHYFHLPPRPSDPVQLADWASRLSHINYLICPDKFVPLGHPITIPHVKTTLKHYVITSTPTAGGNNWSGYEVTNDTFDDAKGNWNTQCLGSNQNAGAQVATWVGIGGENGNLIQTGTVLEGNSYHLFYEYTPNGAFLDSDSIPCGHSIQAEVYYDGSVWCTSVVDINGGSYFSCPYYNWSPDQSTAEWMDDRAICGSFRSGYTFGPLADFKYTGFSNTYAHSVSRNWHTLLGFIHHRVIMQDSNNNATIAAPDDPPSSATTFTDRHVRRDTDGRASCHV